MVSTIIFMTNWIPVTERLPEEKGKYLVSFRRGLLIDLEVDRVWFDGTNFIDVDAWCGDLDITGIVTAWMPLPEPYKEGEIDDEKMDEIERYFFGDDRDSLTQEEIVRFVYGGSGRRLKNDRQSICDI